MRWGAKWAVSGDRDPSLFTEIQQLFLVKIGMHFNLNRGIDKLKNLFSFRLAYSTALVM